MCDCREHEAIILLGRLGAGRLLVHAARRGQPAAALRHREYMGRRQSPPPDAAAVVVPQFSALYIYEATVKTLHGPLVASVRLKGYRNIVCVWGYG